MGKEGDNVKYFLLASLSLLLLLAACETTQDDDAEEPVSDAASEETMEPEEEPTSEPTPTTEPEPTLEPDPTPEPTSEPAETATPEAADDSDDGDEVPEEIAGDIDVQVGQYGYYVNSIGSIEVFGEIVNHGDGHAEIQEILVTLRADDGSVVDSGTSFSHISVVEGGGTIPFSHMFTDAPEDFAEIEFLIEARDPDDAWLVIFENYREFEAIQADWREGNFGNSIVGEIENVGDETAELVQIFIVGYDSEGTLVMVDYSYADRDLIRAGETSPFTARVGNEELSEPAELVVYAEGWITEEE